jgi:uncharacterized protein YbaP (TraB family)
MNHSFGRNIRQALRIFVCVAIVCVLANVVHAEPRLQSDTGKHFLWSLQTKKNTVYFLGSIHVMKSDAYPLAPEIERAYEDSQKIVFETDVDEANDPAVQAKMITLGLYMNGQTLKENVSEETYKLLEEKVVAAGIPMASFDRFRPWFCALTLSVMEFQKLGFLPTHGVDTHFFTKAKKAGKEIIPLESTEYQLALFAKMVELDQESFLRQTLEELEVIATMASDMVHAWKAGDLDKMDSIMKMSFEGHPDIHDRFVVERNKKWIAKIEPLINQDKNALVIVGAGHLVGAQNLLDLLRAKGYRIEQR